MSEEYNQEIAEIKSAIIKIAASNEETAQANIDSARSQAEMATSMAVFREKIETFDSRGCSHGVVMVNGTHRRVDDEVKSLNRKMDKVNDSNWWVKLFGGAAVVIATVISIFI